MRTTAMMAAVFFGVLGVGTAHAGECELSCMAECRQAASVCLATAALSARADKFDCEAEAGDALLECEATDVETRADCGGLCGSDYKGCMNDSKAELRSCKEAAKASLETCKAGAAASGEQDKVTCAQEAAACAHSCMAPPPVQ